MTVDERKEKARRLIDRIWNKGDMEAIDELYSSHCSFHDPSFPLRGTADLKQQVRELREANPDVHMDVHTIFGEGDLTAARYTLGGTQTGDFQGIPASSKSWVMSGISISQWEGDRIVEDWENYDLLGVLQQLEVVPQLAFQD